MAWIPPETHLRPCLTPQYPGTLARMEGQGAGVPADLSPLGVWAAQAHEMYLSLLEAGFTGPEALTILVGMTRQADTD